MTSDTRNLKLAIISIRYLNRNILRYVAIGPYYSVFALESDKL